MSAQTSWFTRGTFVALFSLALSGASLFGQDINQRFAEYNAQMNAGSYGEAERTARGMVEIAPTTNWQAASYNALGRALNSQLRFEEAAPYLEQALKVTLDDANPNRGWIPNNMGHNLRKRKKYAEAEKMFQQARTEFERIFGAKSEQVAIIRSNQGWLYYDQDQFDKAAQTHAEVLAMTRELFGDENSAVGSNYNDLGTAQIGQGKYAESQKNLEEALEIKKAALGSEAPDVAIILGNLADLFRKQKDFKKAEGYSRQSLAIREKLFGHNSQVVAEQLSDLADDLKQQGKTDEAVALLDDVTQIEKALAELGDAADNPFRAGQTIVLKVDRANVMAGPNPIGYVVKGMEFEVTHINGKWCGVKINVGGEVKKGWLDCDQVTLAVVVGTSAPLPELKKEVVSTDGGFRILMPREPSLSKQKENGIEHVAYSVEIPQAKLVAAWFDIPSGSTLSFDAAQAAFAAAREGVIESEDKISLEDEFPGRDSLIRLPDGEYCRMRLIAVKSRHYQLIVEGTKELVTSKGADGYFESFKRAN